LKKASRGNQLLWIVAGAFLVQIAAWTWWFSFAQKNKPKEIPLETAPVQAGKKH
jgi:hypothetical protein